MDKFLREWLPVRQMPWWRALLLAAACVAVGAGVRALASAVFKIDFPFITFFPAVMVAAVWGGFIGGGKYPFGISFLGRLWDDRTVLGLAYAYEQATHHRVAPSTR